VIKRHTKVLIVGTGFSGLGMAAKLKKAGLHDFMILEKASEVGGTWRDNTYPGAECDVPSPVYSFSFHKSPRWSQLFGRQSEILIYLKEVAQKFGLYDHILFGRKVVKAQFLEPLGCWQVETFNGELFTSQHLILGTGGLSRPLVPNIPGIEQFTGSLFHTAEWDHGVSLVGKRVGVIGNGASGIQVVPALAEICQHLTVFQRTPSWVIPKMKYEFSVWERELQRVFPPLQIFLRFLFYCLFEIRALGFFVGFLNKIGEKQALGYLRAKIKDPVLRSKLTPTYGMGCKRVLLSNSFYDTLNLSHVDLISEPILNASPSGLVTKDGKNHVLDVIVFATGFKVAEEPLPFPILGIDGQNLGEKWAKAGVEAYLGTTITGFPNLGILMGPNTGLGHNSMVFMIESQINYYIQGILYTDRHGYDYWDLSPTVQSQFNSAVQEKFKGSIWTEGGCKSWYQNKNGRIVALWPGFSFTFRQALKRFDPAAYRFFKVAYFKEGFPTEDRSSPKGVSHGA
jgi:cation diffusion facilitator CzcD-associated flavoprotein CzcO